jgi:hypothetical protein
MATAAGATPPALGGLAVTLNLILPPDLAERLRQEAARHGLPAEAYTLQLLEERLRPRDRRAAAVALLQSWIDAGDADEQKETGEFLIRALDEDRPSDRKLFPEDLKGVTW